ncbi:SDR family NAD(P)-dependent oxidoreductase [Phaeodactylibacter luteus]|uniref:SDR family NAD(P)-dependent oxidoreductase n=1 Tax=Phaeodactylibacter luteus TaxID=1564516 RepID=A0A5C6S4D0_9BACT|nr:SDR family NAD(P)-dependent oxidoreductase [Phaeodactylibacter luteus]TXB69490.1 SDR family NAD(P)-dependent oxidoreductase [Phaeodactylibacter luteus]
MSTNSIALAYCADNEHYAQKLQKDLAPSGYRFHLFSCNRDTDNNFLADRLLQQSDPILLLISDNFLKSAKCMSRGLKLLQDKRHDILPVIVNGVQEDVNTGERSEVVTEFERVSDIIQYINYWQDKYLDMRRQKRNMAQREEDNFNTHLKVMREVSSEVGEFLRTLRSMTYLSWPQFEANAYQQFFIFTEDNPTWQALKGSLAPVNSAGDLPQHKEEEALAPTEQERTEKVDDSSAPQSIPDEEEPDLSGIPYLDLLPEQVAPGADEEELTPVAEEEIGAAAPSAGEEPEIEPLAGEDEIEAEASLPAVADEAGIEGGMSDEELGDGADWYARQQEQEEAAEESRTGETIFPPSSPLPSTGPESGAPEPAPEAIMADAIAMLRANQAKGAMDLLLSGVQSHPNESTLRYHLALMQVQHSHDYEAAKATLQPIFEQEPHHIDALFLLGELQELASEFEEARSTYSELLRHDEAHAKAHYRLGMVLAAHFEGERTTAAHHFKEAAKLDKTNYDALYQYALLLNDELGKPKKAVKYFKKTLKANAFHPFAYYDMALVYHQLGEYGKAADAYQKAVRINPELQTPENDSAFAVETVAASAAPVANSPAEPLEARHEAVGKDVESIEQTLREKEEELEQLRSALNAFKYPTPPARPTVDQTVLITGATSGIGKATAQIFAEHGYRVILTGRRSERLQAIQQEFESAYEARVQALAFDVRDKEACREAVQQLQGEWADIDLLVNNAGKAKGLAPIHEGDIAHWEEMIDTNLRGLLYMSRLVTPGMVERQSGQVINVCSTAGKEVYPNGNVYNATKFGVDALTKAMRLDLHQHGVRVGMVSPAHVEETEFALVRFDGDASRAKIYDDFKPLSSRDVAEAIFFMATQPAHVNVLDMVLQGTQQASSTMIDRSGRERFGSEEE